MIFAISNDHWTHVIMCWHYFEGNYSIVGNKNYHSIKTPILKFEEITLNVVFYYVEKMSHRKE